MFLSNLKDWNVLRFLSGLLFAFLMVPAAGARSTTATEAIVIDVVTGDTLFEKNADVQMTPSSMTKILTAYVVINEIEAGRLSLTDEFQVSRQAYNRGGSSMFLLQGQSVTVLDLLYGLIVVSGNDAAITLATGVSGSEAAFAELMNETARALGMQNSNFVNASGWPDDNHYSTARDIAILSMRMISDHPSYYNPIFSTREFIFNGVRQQNRNPLLGANFRGLPDNFLVADGLKTGTTERGGHGLAGSAIDASGRRVVMVLNGMSSKDERRAESIGMMHWAFTELNNFQLFRAGQVVGYAPVWLGLEDHVPLHATQSLILTLSAASFANMEANLIYNSPLEAPVYVDQPVGHIQLTAPGIDPILVPVVAGQSVDSVGRFQQVLTGLQYSVLGLEN